MIHRVVNLDDHSVIDRADVIPCDEYILVNPHDPKRDPTWRQRNDGSWLYLKRWPSRPFDEGDYIQAMGGGVRGIVFSTDEDAIDIFSFVHGRCMRHSCSGLYPINEQQSFFNALFGSQDILDSIPAKAEQTFFNETQRFMAKNQFDRRPIRPEPLMMGEDFPMMPVEEPVIDGTPSASTPYLLLEGLHSDELMRSLDDFLEIRNAKPEDVREIDDEVKREKAKQYVDRVQTLTDAQAEQATKMMDALNQVFCQMHHQTKGGNPDQNEP